MNKSRLFLFVFFLLESTSLFALEETGQAFDCRNAQEALREIQRQQMSLTPGNSSESLLELEERFDRHKAHLILLKGMQKLNQEYRNFETLIREQGATPTQSKDELLELSEQMKSHHQSAQKVAIANQFLTVLSSNDSFIDGAIKKLVGKENATINPRKIEKLFQEHCSRALASEQCKKFNDSNHFFDGMAQLLSDAAGALNVDCTQARDCQTERGNKFKENVVTYRNKLLEHIQESQWEEEKLADQELQKMTSAQENLSTCTGNCKVQTKNLIRAINAYRNKVRSLEKVKDGSKRAWSALKEFNETADKIRTDTWRNVSVNENLINRFVQAPPDQRTVFKLTPTEHSIAKMRIARQETFNNLTSNSYHQSREEIRQNFARETHTELESFFSDDSLNVRFERFNKVLNRLMETEDNVGFLSLNNKKIALNENTFFKHLDGLDEKKRGRLQQRIDGEIAAVQKELDSLGEKILSIKNGPDAQNGDKLKHYIFNQLQKNCGEMYDADVEAIRCKFLPGSDPGKIVLGLGKNFGEILAVMENPQDPDHIKAYRQICRSSSRYHAACSIVNRNYRRSHPSGSIQDVLKKTKRETFVYDRRGRRTNRILHDHSRGDMLAYGLVYGLGQNMETSFMYIARNHFYDQLNDYVDLAQQEKTWYHQSEQYRQYAEDRWVKDMFDYLNPNFSPPTN